MSNPMFLNNLFSGNSSVQYDDDSIVHHDESHVFSEKDQFCMCMAALEFQDEDDFQNFLRAYEILSDFNLMKHLNAAMKDPRDAWNSINSYSDLSSEELFQMVEGSLKVRENDSFKAVRSVLWNSGSARYEVGFSPILPHSDIRDISIITENSQQFFSSAKHWKIATMANAFDALIALFPLKHRRTGNDSGRYDKVKEYVGSFANGIVEFNLKGVVKYPKEMGIVLAHTLPPREWIARMLSGVFKDLFGTDRVFPVFHREGSDVSIFDYSFHDYLLVDDFGSGFDSDQTSYEKEMISPYRLDSSHPSFIGNQSDDGFWFWREVVHSAIKHANLDLRPGDSLDEIVQKRLTDEVEELNSDVTFQSTSFPYIIATRRRDVFVKCFKRGYSKEEEVKNNPSFLHVVKMSVCSKLPNRLYVKFCLSDFYSVLLIPTDLWTALGKDNGYFTQHGCVLSGFDLAQFRNVVFMLQLSCTIAFLDSMDNGEFDPSDYMQNVLDRVVSSNSMGNMFSGLKFGARKEFVATVNKLIVGGSFGLIATSERSRVGARTTQKMSANGHLNAMMGGFTYGSVENSSNNKNLLQSLFADEDVDVSDDSAEMEDPDNSKGDQIHRTLDVI